MFQSGSSTRVFANSDWIRDRRGGVLERPVAETTVNVMFGAFLSGVLLGCLAPVPQTICFCMISVTLCAKP